MKRRIKVPLMALALLSTLALTSANVRNMVIYGPALGSAIGAKLLCSLAYVSGRDRKAALADVQQYSALLAQLHVRYDDEARRVSADLLGLAPRSASFRPGLGCYLDYPESVVRNNLEPPPPDYALPAQLAWPEGSATPHIDSALQGLIEQIIQRDNQRGLNTRAIVVARNGELIAEAYAQGASQATQLHGWSMAKSLTSIMLGNLEMRGLLDPGKLPVFAEWASDDRAKITLENLYQMVDGLHFDERYAPGDDVTRMLFTEPGAAAYALNSTSSFPAGEHFNYSSGTANLLALLHRRAFSSAQAALDDYYQHIVTPMALRHATFEPDATGVIVGSSYLYATARDWTRMGQLMLNGGRINGQQIVTPAWVQRATSPNPSQNYPAYGYQWWLNRGGQELHHPELPADMFFASGNRKQIVAVFPGDGVVVTRLGWTSDEYPTAQNLREILDSLAESDDRNGKYESARSNL